MSPLVLAIALGALVVANLVAWIAFRVDKARARRGVRRISERRLLGLSAVGGAGALLGMYAHRRRHKVDKRGFRAVVWLLALLQLAALATAGVFLLGLAACGDDGPATIDGDVATQADTLDTAADATGDTGPASDASEPEGEVLFAIELVEARTIGLTGIAPIATAWAPPHPEGEPTLQRGACTLYAGSVEPFCDPACASGTVCRDVDGAARCITPPAPVGAGDIVVTGLRVALTLHPETQYFYYAPRFEPYPDDGELFDADAAISATAAGDPLPPFTVTARGVAALETPLACPPTLVADAPLVVTWTPTAPPAERVRFRLEVGNHGGQFVHIACETDDVGSLTVDAALVAGYLAGHRPLELWVLERVNEGRTAVTGGVVALRAGSQVACRWQAR